MLRTITISTTISVQGQFLRALENGKTAVTVGSRIFIGTPIT